MIRLGVTLMSDLPSDKYIEILERMFVEQRQTCEMYDNTKILNETISKMVDEKTAENGT